ncbi:Crp/Fnr family transcriptional regulator [Thermoactinomyces sp. DSM 45892]|uniref:Crp/Fnr family transcriptional regulator n=1 Tax=Thermoactinomyces sp. DSM 45892 TaxID=1882753 RepID=UPI0008995B6F|nr:Crp/Fnr family transcriptional regulator [Thermoactinomyces sp. DSM 45892]SDY02803.1 cAMP-binding domain of CRP or a regulatory subunit of cAMP-dependent protein kinases [Thermoactinomyces sp. DSM 45892]
MSVQTLCRGEILFRQEDQGDYLYYLESGLLKVTRMKEDGSTIFLNILVPGETFPHHSLVSPKDYHGTVIALTTSEIVKIPAEHWYESIQQEPIRYRSIAQTLQNKLRMMQQRIDILTAPPQERPDLFRKWLQLYFQDYHIEDLFTQEEISQFIGLSRETVNRILRKKGSN